MLALKNILYIAILLSIPSAVLAQPYYIRGKVQDEKGNLLQNVTILQSSTGYKYYSGNTGSFGITTTKKIDTFNFSFSGYITQKLVVNATDFINVQLKIDKASSTLHGYNLSSFTKNLQREVQEQWFVGDETYASTIENRFVNAASYPVTSLKLNVDRASYSNIRRFLNMNSEVPADAVRIEEMLNYFNFKYSEPKNHKTFEIQTTLTACPWNSTNQLLFAKITSKKINLDTLPPTHLVFLIDVSGSMDMPNRLPILKAGFNALVNNLRAKDSVSLVVYGGTVGVLLNAVSGVNKDSIFKVIDALEPGGSTPGESGIKLAYSVAKAHFIKGGNNRVILATDGDFNVGLKSEDELAQLVSKQKESGIYLTCLGVGMGNYKDSKIQVLAQKGNGNFAYIDSYAEAEKVLLKEFMQTLYTVADDVHLDVHLNPALIKDYRIIGFDNKVGAIRDSLAVIEGGEIGPAYSLLVAFEIVPAVENVEKVKSQSPLQPCTFNLTYTETATKRKCSLAETPDIRYQKFESTDSMYRFASAVILFGSLLRDSEFTKSVSWNTALELAMQSVDMTNASQKELLGLIQEAKKIYSKRKRHS